MDIEYDTVNTGSFQGIPDAPLVSRFVLAATAIERWLGSILVFLGVKTSAVAFFALGIVCLLVGAWQLSIAWDRQHRLHQHRAIIRANMQQVISKKRSITVRGRANSIAHTKI